MEQKPAVYHFGEFKTQSANGILHVIHSYSQLLSRDFAFNTVCFHPSWPADRFAQRQEGSVTVHEFGCAGLKGFLLPKQFGSWLASLKGSSVFHLHATFKPINFALARLIKKTGNSYIFTPHNPYEGPVLARRGLLKRVYIAAIERWVLQNATLVHALTPRELLSLKKLGASRIVVVPNMVSAPTGVRPRAADKRREAHICFVGRIEPVQKGIDIMLASISELKQRYQKTVTFELCGPIDSEAEAFVRRKCLELKLELGRDVILTGPIYGTGKVDLIKNAEVYLQLSRWEGLPISVLEAMALGTPVVVSNEVPVRIGCDDFRGGFAVADHAAAAAALFEILGCDDDKYYALCEGSRRVYETFYSPSVVQRDIVAMYKSAFRIAAGDSVPSSDAATA